MVTDAANWGEPTERKRVRPAVPESVESLLERPHWTVSGSVATYAPQVGGWVARVRRLNRWVP